MPPKPHTLTKFPQKLETHLDAELGRSFRKDFGRLALVGGHFERSAVELGVESVLGKTFRKCLTPDRKLFRLLLLLENHDFLEQMSCFKGETWI